MIDVVEILQHWHAGRPKSVVASSLGVDPKTVRKYVAPAEEAGMSPGGEPPSRAEWAERARGWFPELVDARARSLTFSVIDAHRAAIAEMLKTNTVATVHQRLRDEAGLAVSATSFRRCVCFELPAAADLSKVTVMRPEVPAGEPMATAPMQSSPAWSNASTRCPRASPAASLVTRAGRWPHTASWPGEAVSTSTLPSHTTPGSADPMRRSTASSAATSARAPTCRSTPRPILMQSATGSTPCLDGYITGRAPRPATLPLLH